jgi:hypothetical protein
MKTTLNLELSIAFAVILTTGCSKQQASCPPSQVIASPATSAPLTLPPVAPPQAVSLADAKRVFSAHDCCDRYINTDFYRVGALRARGRIFTIFQMSFANPESRHGMQHVAILDGMRLVGTYQIYGSDVRLDGSRITFECDNYSRRYDSKVCAEAEFQDIDLSEPHLPETRLIFGQLSYLSDSI